jgi:UDP-N-acetylglucosamine 2-epimerase
MNKEFIKGIVAELKASKKRTYFACHPKTFDFMHSFISATGPNRMPHCIKMGDAIDYFQLLSLLKVVDEVWTDSGGLIREAYWAGKKIRSLRERTEWDQDIAERNSFGDGKACQKILDIVSKT